MTPGWAPLFGELEAQASWTVFTVILVHTGIFIFGVIVLMWGRRRTLSWINRQTVSQLQQRLGVGQMRRINLRQLLLLTRLLVRLISMALLLAGVAVWFTGVLDAIPYTHEIGTQLEDSVWRELHVLIRECLRALPGVGIVLLICFLARVFTEMVDHYFRTIESGESTSEVWDPVTAQMTRRLAAVGIWVAAVIVGYPYIPGSQSAAFKGVSLLAGLMLSLGSTNLVSQLINGLILAYSRAIRPGDAIIVQDTEGVVERLGFFSSALRTANDELIWLPNSKLAEGVRNNSRPVRSDSVLFTTQVTIGYDAPWQQVRGLLLAAAATTNLVRKEPAPFVRQVALEDFYVRYELVFAPADPAKRKAVLTELHEGIQDAFHGAGVQIMSPHYLGDPARAKIPPAPEKN